MADKWVSTGKRYCEICKVWFGNNKASQDHHDRGDRHKAMLANRIRETMQKGKRDEMANERLNATLARMNAAATSSMARHGEGIMQGPSLPATGLRMNIFDPKQHKDVSSMAREMADRRDGNLKRKGLSGSAPPPIGAPSLKVTKDDVVSAYRDLINPSAHGPALPESHAVSYMPENQIQMSEIQWVRTTSDQGTYYWNIFDGTTKWEQPLHFYTEEQYEQKCKEFEESRERNYYGLDDVKAVRMGKTDVEQFIKDKVSSAEMAAQIEQNRKEMQYNEKPAKGKKGERRRQWEEKKRLEEEEEARRLAENVKKENSEEFDGIPADDQGTSSSLSSLVEICFAAPPPPPPPQAEEFEEEAEPTVKQELEEDVRVPEVKQLAPPQVEKPLPPAIGGWIRITKEEKSDVPFESPLTARYREEEEREKLEAEKREKDEPKIEFGEKTAVIMTKKVKGPIEFKKKSKSINIRKREE